MPLSLVLPKSYCPINHEYLHFYVSNAPPSALIILTKESSLTSSCCDAEVGFMIRNKQPEILRIKRKVFQFSVSADLVDKAYRLTLRIFNTLSWFAVEYLIFISARFDVYRFSEFWCRFVTSYYYEYDFCFVVKYASGACVGSWIKITLFCFVSAFNYGFNLVQDMHRLIMTLKCCCYASCYNFYH